jgi:hypothetical protein
MKLTIKQAEREAAKRLGISVITRMNKGKWQKLVKEIMNEKEGQ